MMKLEQLHRDKVFKSYDLLLLKKSISRTIFMVILNGDVLSSNSLEIVLLDVNFIDSK
jgi:hypothetical protein